MESLSKTLETYFGETFGEQARLESGRSEADRLPIFIGQLYYVKRMTFLGRRLTLFFPKAELGNPTPTEIKAHITSIRKRCGDDFAFVFSALAPYEKSRFIQARVPFIVPRRQTYLPQYVIDLRGRANSAKNRQAVEEESQSLSGPAQVLLLFYLQHSDHADEWSLRQWAKTLGYSTMTATRICDELSQCGLCRTETNGKRVILQFYGDRRGLWKLALPYLRSPVKRTVCAARAEIPKLDWCYAGLTALAQYTLIADGKNPVYAMRASEYRRAAMSGLVDEQKYLEKGSLIIEQWRYRPQVLTHDQAVDRLSLYLALRDDHDERIEAALGELLEGVKW
jgi:hypothetical protein